MGVHICYKAGFVFYCFGLNLWIVVCEFGFNIQLGFFFYMKIQLYFVHFEWVLVLL